MLRPYEENPKSHARKPPVAQPGKRNANKTRCVRSFVAKGAPQDDNACLSGGKTRREIPRLRSE